jgi:hypothetical protein
VATFATSSLAIGTHSLTAVYAGNATNASSTSTALSLVVRESFLASDPMSQARVSHTATLLGDGRVLITGGYAAVGNKVATKSAEIYCPNPYTPPVTPARTLAQWCPNGLGKFSAAGRGNDKKIGLGNMTQARMFHTATMLPNGTVLLVGGYGASGDATATAEIYDTADRPQTSSRLLPTCRARMHRPPIPRR